MDVNGFVGPITTGSEEFYRKSLKQFAWQKKLQGTKVVVQRIKKDSKYNDVLGINYSNNLQNSTEVETFNYVVVINAERMVKVYNENSETIDFMDDQNVLQLGDVLVFTRNSREFRFKITDMQTFTQVGGYLNQYTMTPYIVVDLGNDNYEQVTLGDDGWISPPTSGISANDNHNTYRSKWGMIEGNIEDQTDLMLKLQELVNRLNWEDI